jgi:hypothetical protein
LCYVGGDTNSAAFPVTSNAQRTTSYGGLGSDVFFTKIDTVRGTVSYSTYWGGTSDDHLTSLALIERGNGTYAAITGYTLSQDIPVVQAIQTRLAGGYDSFVAVFHI